MQLWRPPHGLRWLAMMLSGELVTCPTGCLSNCACTRARSRFSTLVYPTICRDDKKPKHFMSFFFFKINIIWGIFLKKWIKEIQQQHLVYTVHSIYILFISIRTVYFIYTAVYTIYSVHTVYTYSYIYLFVYFFFFYLAVLYIFNYLGSHPVTWVLIFLPLKCKCELVWQ